MRGATIDDSLRFGVPGERAATPGLVIVFSGKQPLLRAISVPEAGVLIGRDDAGGLPLPDPRSSRDHLRATREDGRIVVEDLDSKNGTFVDGMALPARRPSVVGEVVRMGQTVLLPCADVTPYASGMRTHAELIAGPSMQAALERLRAAAARGGDVLVLGESGTGKELAARHYHAESGRKGPLVAVNCATIPSGVAERLLFGTEKGAFSGAVREAPGYFEAAERGVLFLDEFGELEPAVQAKLLRVLETREILPLGAAQAQPVDVRVFAATNRELRALVGEGRFRDDLWFRLAEHTITLPTLRERREEIPFLLARFVAEVAPEVAVHATLVEACLRRMWPGNVRELRAAARKAVAHAQRRGAAVVLASDLDGSDGFAPGAGMAAPAAVAVVGAAAAQPLPTALPPVTTAPAPPPPVPVRKRAPVRPPPARDELLAVLAAANHNLAEVARVLGAQRTQVYRWLEKHGIEHRGGAAGEADVDDEVADVEAAEEG